MTRIERAVAKLHLENGDALIVDGRIIDASTIARSLHGVNARVYAVIPRRGQTLKNAFTIMLESELKTLTREKLKEILDATNKETA